MNEKETITATPEALDKVVEPTTPEQPRTSTNETAENNDTKEVNNDLVDKELTDEEIDNLTEEELDFLLGEDDVEPDIKDNDTKEELTKEEEEAKRKQREFNKNAEEKRKRLKYQNEVLESGYTRKEEDILRKQIREAKELYNDFNTETLDNDNEWLALFKDNMFKKPLKDIYKDYLDNKKEKQENERKYRINQRLQSSSGTSKSGVNNQEDATLYSEKELKDILNKMPYMNQKEIDRIMEKVNKSIDYYEKKGID